MKGKTLIIGRAGSGKTFKALPETIKKYTQINNIYCLKVFDKVNNEFISKSWDGIDWKEYSNDINLNKNLLFIDEGSYIKSKEHFDIIKKTKNVIITIQNESFLPKELETIKFDQKINIKR